MDCLVRWHEYDVKTRLIVIAPFGTQSGGFTEFSTTDAPCQFQFDLGWYPLHPTKGISEYCDLLIVTTGQKQGLLNSQRLLLFWEICTLLEMKLTLCRACPLNSEKMSMKGFFVTTEIGHFSNVYTCDYNSHVYICFYLSYRKLAVVFFYNYHQN